MSKSFSPKIWRENIVSFAGVIWPFSTLMLLKLICSDISSGRTMKTMNPIMNGRMNSVPIRARRAWMVR